MNFFKKKLLSPPTFKPQRKTVLTNEASVGVARQKEPPFPLFYNQ